MGAQVFGERTTTYFGGFLSATVSCLALATPTLIATIHSRFWNGAALVLLMEMLAIVVYSVYHIDTVMLSHATALLKIDKNERRVLHVDGVIMFFVS
ncbi:hypothetical protein GGF31_003579 [Allomyces arbusculus]|nr:hypothetical protein GGF31_003579 [Allomyces arbusculus]